jgi:hypothetical protein
MTPMPNSAAVMQAEAKLKASAKKESPLASMSVSALIRRYIPFVAATAVSIFIYDWKRMGSVQGLTLLLSQLALAIAGVVGFFRSRHK